MRREQANSVPEWPRRTMKRRLNDAAARKVADATAAFDKRYKRSDPRGGSSEEDA